MGYRLKPKLYPLPIAYCLLPIAYSPAKHFHSSRVLPEAAIGV